MGLAKTIGSRSVLAGAFGAGLLCMAQSAGADGIEDMLLPGSVVPVQLAGEGRVLTEDQAQRMLESEGFAVVETKRTLLGRIRIVAEGPQGQREIVLHAGDGRVMRDLFIEADRPAAVIRPAEPIAAEPPPKDLASDGVVPPDPATAVGTDAPAAAPIQPEPSPTDPQDVSGAAP